MTVITEYHCTIATRKKTIGNYILSSVPREGDMVHISGKLYIVDYITWNFDSQAVNAVSVAVFVK